MGFYTRKQLWMESVHIIIFLVMIVSAIYFYGILPDRIPTHWNASGTVDAYGSKNTIFIFPAIYLATYLLLLFLPTIDVFKENAKKSFRNYYGIRLFMGLFFLALFIATTLTNFYEIQLTQFIILALDVLFIALGYFMRDIKRNFFAGIRTPWALSDDKVWTDTHKMAGNLYMIAGAVAFIVGAFLANAWTFYITIILVIGVSIYSAAYSYVLFKRSGKPLNRIRRP